MLIGTVGRLLDFVQRGCIDVSNLRFLVIDEADRQLMDGFEESLQQFLQVRVKLTKLVFFCRRRRPIESLKTCHRSIIELLL